jgi:hypothetical protein
LLSFFLNESKKTKDFDSKKSQRWQYYDGAVTFFKKASNGNDVTVSIFREGM